MTRGQFVASWLKMLFSRPVFRPIDFSEWVTPDKDNSSSSPNRCRWKTVAQAKRAALKAKNRRRNRRKS